jgi:hypothetical protein
MFFRILHHAGFDNFKIAELRNEIFVGIIMDFTSGLALEGVLLNHPARAITGLLIGEYNEEHYPAILKLLPASLQECRSVVLPEQVKNIETVYAIILLIVKGHIKYRSEVIVNFQRALLRKGNSCF